MLDDIDVLVSKYIPVVIGNEESIFDNGASSFTAIQIIQVVNSHYKINLTLEDFFTQPTKNRIREEIEKVRS